MEKINIENVKNGIVLFTFDDRNFPGWINALPVFEKYGAHASFFVSGDIDEEALSAIKTLCGAGHTVGLHTKNHINAREFFEKYPGERYFENEILVQKEILDKNGIDVHSFGYPNNARNDETDAFLSKYFDRFRAGVKGASEDEIYVPIHKLCENRVMHGFGIGEYYNTVEEDLFEKIRKTARENVCTTFFSHNIMEKSEHINMALSLLEKCLALAKENGVLAVGLDELP